jgi:probable F420-dependent oxidoreductase
MELWQGIHFAPTEGLGDLARHAEELGFTGLAFGDHQVMPSRQGSRYPYSADGLVKLPSSAPFPDPWVAASAMAMVTRTLRFTTHVYVLPLRDPFTVAKSIATASILSGGRMAIGVGVGWQKEEFDASGIDFRSRGRRTDEMLQVMRALWSGGPVSHQGEFYQFEEIELSPAPFGAIDVLIGGHTEPALRRAASSDGWIPLRFSREESHGQLARLHELRDERKRSGAPFQVQCMFPRGVEIGDAQVEEAREIGATAVVAPPMPLDTPLGVWKRTMEMTATTYFALKGGSESPVAPRTQ